MTTSERNMAEYRRTKERSGGGLYGTQQAINHGWDPPARLIFFDDFTQIRQDEPTKNFHPDGPDGGGRTEVIQDNYTGATTTVFQWQLFYKAERTFNNIRFLSFPNIQINMVAGYANIATVGNFFWDFAIDISLLKVPLDIGADPVNPFALDKLTWNNSFFKSTHMSGPLSTLYATAANFRAFNVPDIGGGFASAQLKDTGGVTFQGNSGISMYYINFPGGPSPGNRDNADDGPFFGVHIYFNLSNEGGFFIDPVPQGSKVGTSIATGLLGAPVGASSPDIPRPFIIVDDFDILE